LANGQHVLTVLVDWFCYSASLSCDALAE